MTGETAASKIKTALADDDEAVLELAADLS